MAILETKAVKKGLRARGNYAGKTNDVTGDLLVTATSVIPTTDTIHALLVGENTRINRVVLQFIPTSGTPVIVNPTFAVGIKQLSSAAYVDAKGTSYPAPTTSATGLVASMVLDAADDMKQDIEVLRGVADSVASVAPYYITLTPAGAGSFSCTGGTGVLKLTVEFIGNEDDSSVYTEFNATKVKN